ncbi:MAG: oligoendopeptidase F [bacterium]
MKFKTIALWIALLGIAILATGPTIMAADDQAVPQREEIGDQYKWKVEDIYGSLEQWEADYQHLDSSVASIDAFKGRLSESPEVLLECLKLSDSLDIIVSNLYVYAYLKLDEDNRQSQYQELGGRISQLNSRLGTAQSFIRPELLTLDKATVDRFMAAKPELETYRFYLEDQLRRQEHILSPKEENLLALASSVTRSPQAVFNMVENADLKLGTVADPDGNLVDLTWGRYSNIMRQTDRDYRSRANDTVQASYLRYINTLAATLDASTQKDWFLAQARGYNSCLEHSLDNDNIPVDVFHNLIKTVNENLEPLHRWNALRKRVLGYDTLWTYDLSVPLLPEFEKKYSYEEGKDLVQHGLQPMGSDYLSDFGQGLNSGWIDAFENEGKGSGAYSWGTYTSHPYILLNWSGQLGDVFTLAHEMGHALNSYYSNRNEPYVYSNHSLFTAEVASTCNEAVLMKYLLANAETKEEKMVLLNYYIEQIEGTFFTQVMFSEFEMAIHDQIENGGATSVDYFRKTYRDIFQKYGGPDVMIGPNNDMSGMKISHFYREYYVYQYATCYAAAQALSQKILEGDPGALDKYMQFLATGSSKYPVDILKAAGVDMTQPDAVERTVRLFGELVTEMENLMFPG